MDRSDSVPAQKTMLQEILGLAFIGEYLTTAVALVPAILLALVWEGADPRGEVGGGFMIVAGLVSAWWLNWLERHGRVRITTPVLPVPLLWLVPIVILAGIVELF